jgi:hypothetical protein
VSPVLHKLRLLHYIRCGVIVVKGLCFLAPKEHLADEVERVRTAAEATVNSIKAPLR